MGLPLAKPSRIGKYEIIDVIGRGGMGVVYKATDPRIGRFVAIKMLTAAFGEEPELLTRFYNEAKYTGGLQHSNIVTVYELGDQDGYPYLVMEYLEGESLDSIMSSQKQLLLGEKIGIVIQVCNGLRFAHERGLVHRDIKPANIVVLNDGTVKIVDFGIAHVRGSRLTRANQIIGSIYYMSPEQLSGTVEVDLRTDIYSTGVVLFQLLTGVLPFEGKDTGSTMMKIVHDPPPPIGRFLRISPPELEAINYKALAKDRDERYSSIEDFAFDLTRLQQQWNQDIVVDQLRQANAAFERKEYATAKQVLLRVLQMDRQNTRANDLLRKVQQALQVHQRTQQVGHLKIQAEEALTQEHFDSALLFVEQALEIDRDNLELQNLRTAAITCRDRALRFDNAMGRAEANRKSGDLEAAKKAAEEALSVQPGSADAKKLHSSISSELVRRVEPAPARLNDQPAQLPPRIPPARVKADAPVFSATGTPFSEETKLLSESDLQDVVEYQQVEVERPSPVLVQEERQTHGTIPEELREFLPPPPRRWLRPAIYAAVVIALLASGAVYLTQTRSSERIVAPAANSYVEINAEPWGTVTGITGADGKALLQQAQVTPVRVMLPPGTYTIAVTGPNGSEQTVQTEVPQQGGARAFVGFHKPDLNKILQQ